MGTNSSDRVLLTARPSRLLLTHYYLLVLLLLAAALALAAGVIPGDVLGRSVRHYIAGFLAAVALLVLLVAELRRIGQKYTVYEHRVGVSEGLLRRRTQYMPYRRIERVEVDQSLLGRVFGVGDLVVDTGDDDMTLRGIRKPGRVEELVSRLIRGPLSDDERTG